jgi:hypothetical protein
MQLATTESHRETFGDNVILEKPIDMELLTVISDVYIDIECFNGLRLS